MSEMHRNKKKARIVGFMLFKGCSKVVQRLFKVVQCCSKVVQCCSRLFNDQFNYIIADGTDSVDGIAISLRQAR